MHGRVDRFLTLPTTIEPLTNRVSEGLTDGHTRSVASGANRAIRGGNVTQNSGDATARR
jgi:hypothetical protein